MNTSANSSVCVYGEANCKSLVEANSEFRGHASVTETGPDGRQTITTYTQTDADAGQPGNSKLKSASGALLRETIYTWSSTDLGLYGVPAGYTKFGFVHNWIYPASTESRVYAANGTSFSATRTSDTYQATYGNLTTQAEQSWTGSAWATYRSTSWDYFPNPNNGRYLVGLPARQQVKNAAGSVLAETLNLYDGSNVYTTAPTLGRLTAVRTWVSGTQYGQASYAYDIWGNGTSVTQYTGYGTASTAPTTGAQTSYTCYGSGGTLGGTACLDDGYHSYPLWSKNALGQVTSVAYDCLLGVPVSETDPNDAVTTATYDIFGRILSVTRPLDPQPALSMSYQDSFPFTTTTTKYGDGGIGYSLVRKYDGMGRNFETTAGGIVTTTGYDGYGRVIWQSVPGGTEGTATGYDALGRPLSVVSPDGTSVSYSYDDLRTTVTEPDANGGTHNTVTATDVWGRVVSVMPPSGPGVIYTYDELDRLKAAERGGLTTSLTYDQAGRKLSMSDPDMGSWGYTYDALGNLATQTDTRGCLLTLSYDPLNRLVGKASSGAGCGTQVTTGYSYDAGSNGTGRRTGMTDASGSTSWSYDARGRLISESKSITGEDPFVTGWGYNLADLPATMTYPDGEVLTSSYNTRMLLDTLGSYVSGTTYDAAGRMTQRAYGNGTQTDYAYYPWTGQGGRLQQILTRQMPSQSVIQDLGYTYDPAGNITQIANPVAAETQQYGYDALDRLTQWRVNGHLSGQYAYDPYSGNLAGKGTTALSYGTPADDNPGTSGLAAWWSLDETEAMRADSQGANPLTDGITPGYAAGVKGNAASFAPAQGRWLTAADNPALSTGDVDFTLRAHVYLNSLSETMIVAVKGDASDMTKRDYTLFYDGATHFAFRVGNGSTQAVVVSGAVAAGQWYSVTAWHDSLQDTLNIQLDDGAVSSLSYSSGALDTALPLSVGAFENGVYPLDGKVDELALFKRVLSAAERTWLYNNGQGRTYAEASGMSDMAAWWSMDETGGMRSDSQGTSHLYARPSTASAAGVRGNAAHFTPTGSNYLAAADSPAISTGDIDFSLRANVYLNNVNTTTIIAMKGEKDNMSRRDFTLFVDGTAHAIGFRVGNGTTSGVVLSSAVTAGRWYTVTAWHDAAANSLKIQLDDGAVVSASYSGGGMDTSQPLSVGAFADGTYLLDGRVDELALYKRVLTAAERTWLYHNGQGRAYADVAGVVQLHAVLGAVTDGSYVCPQGETCDYDQAQTGVDNSYGYDANGNQVTRTINGVTLTLSYDAEGHLVSVSGQGINAAFTYDGDGKRVKSTINGGTTYFVGNYYEQTGSTIAKYYYAGSQRVAMKTGSTVHYLLADHLGSTSLTTDASGNVVSQLRYSAWGSVRYQAGNTPTEYTFTGQYGYDFGLMYFNARWLDVSISHFAQADTVIPGAGNPQAWDRYTYTMNNPSRYTDPSGHRACDDEYGDCVTRPIKTIRPPQPPTDPTGGQACAEQHQSIICIAPPQLPMPSAPLQPVPIPNPTLDPGYSDPEIDALFWFWDEVASPFFSSVEMYDIYRISNKGGWKAARYALPTGVIEASVAGLRQGYFDSWTQTLSPIERTGRIFVVFSETLATDAAANLAGDAGAIIGGPLGPIGAAAGYGTAAALVTHAADRFWAQAINPQFVPRAGLGIWP